MPLITLMDIVKANIADPAVGLIDETIQTHPELLLGSARTIPGINYKTLVRTALPANTAGSFRAANAGSLPLKSAYENRQVDTYMLQARIECDRQMAEAYLDGAAAYISMEAQAV